MRPESKENPLWEWVVLIWWQGTTVCAQDEQWRPVSELKSGTTTRPRFNLNDGNQNDPRKAHAWDPRARNSDWHPPMALPEGNSGSILGDPMWQMSVAHKEILAVTEFGGNHQRGTWGNKVYRGYSKAEMRKIAFRETKYIKYGKNAIQGVKVAGFAIDGYTIATAEPGKPRHDAIASAAGSTGGALGGAAIGAGIGNLPGAIIGGFLGGVGGSFLESDHVRAVTDVLGRGIPAGGPGDPEIDRILGSSTGP